MRIDPKDLRSEVQGLLDQFGWEAEACIRTATEKTAKQVVKELKTGNFGFNDKSYSKGWTRKMTSKRLSASVVIYNKTEGQLTHLLEFGHAKRNGGRTRAFPHIAPINDKVPEMFVDNFTDALADQLINNT